MPKEITPKNKFWDWYLLLSIFLYQAIPALYNSYSIYLIGNYDPNESGLAIISQWQTIQIILEIIQESLIFPIYFFIGSKVLEKNKELVSNRISSCIRLILAILIPITILIYAQADSLVDLTNTPITVAKETTTYLKIRVWSILISIINLSLFVVIESLKKKSLIIRILIYKTLLFILFDSLFYGGHTFSLGLGINGVAFSNILTELILFIFITFHFKINFNINVFQNFFSFKFQDFHLFSKISSWLVVESVIRNSAYLIMIVSLVNSLGTKQIGGYYLTMHLFWSILLVPILAISETLKVQTANYSNNIEIVRHLMFHALKIGLFIVLAWTVAIPIAGSIFNYLSTDSSIHGFALESFYALFIPYCLMSLNIIIDSVFYGMGKTKFLAYQSIITNVLVYLTGYIAYKAEIWDPTLISILILFSIGIVVDSFLTVIYWNILYKKSVLNKS